MVQLHAQKEEEVIDESWVVSAEFTHEEKKSYVHCPSYLFHASMETQFRLPSFLFPISLLNEVLDCFTNEPI